MARNISGATLAAIERLAREAIEGPWYVCGSVVCSRNPDGDGDTPCDGPCEDYMVAQALQSMDEAEFIAALNPAVALELCEIVRRLGEECHG